MKYVSLDIETTGLNPENCQILQIGAIIEDTNSVLPYEELPKFNCLVEHEFYSGQPTALAMNSWIFEIFSKMERLTKDERLTYRKEHNILPVGLVARSFQMWLIDNGLIPEYINEPVKINVAGKNFGTFDLRFLKKLPNWGNSVSVRQRILDPGGLVINWETDETLPNLNACLTRLELDGEVTHDSLADAWDVIRVIRKVTHNYNLRVY